MGHQIDVSLFLSTSKQTNKPGSHNGTQAQWKLSVSEQRSAAEAALIEVWFPEQGGNKSVISHSSDSLFTQHRNSACRPSVTSFLPLEVTLSIIKFLLAFCILVILINNIFQVPTLSSESLCFPVTPSFLPFLL